MPFVGDTIGEINKRVMQKGCFAVHFNVFYDAHPYLFTCALASKERKKSFIQLYAVILTIVPHSTVK